jgi:hypothetical protein
MPRALSLLAAYASPVFMCAAIAGWLFEAWPANPLTLGVAAVLTMGGPVLGIVHVATADTWEDDLEEDTAEAPTAVLPARAAAPTAFRAAATAGAHAPSRAAAAQTTSRATTPAGAHATSRAAATAAPAVPEPPVLTAKAADARRFASWRDTPNDAITQRERARRANQYVRS